MLIGEYVSILEQFAPLSLSKAFVEKGAHDNSGLLVKMHDEVKVVAFGLDLTDELIEYAISVNADTIVTHHPVIYYPISNIGVDANTINIAKAVKNNFNVISMHLNLDISSGGIDESLASGLGAFQATVIDEICPNYGYGREFTVEKTSFDSFIENVKKEFNLKNYSVYKSSENVQKVASFCGGGYEDAVKYSGDADLIVTSDMPHHAILSLLERKKSILLMTHYASEIYGFKKFYNRLKDIVLSHIFIDERYL